MWFSCKTSASSYLGNELVQLVKSVGVLPDSVIKVIQLHRTKATYTVVHDIGYHVIELLRCCMPTCFNIEHANC